MRKTVWLCHRCHVATEPDEDCASGGFCDVCRGRCTHFIVWSSPEEDVAARLLIEREIGLACGGWDGSDRAKQAMADAESLRLAFDEMFAREGDGMVTIRSDGAKSAYGEGEK